MNANSILPGDSTSAMPTKASPDSIASRPQAMIAVWLHVAPEREEEFNAWYEQEHIPQIVDLPGFASGTRYASDDAFPKFMALYETVDETVEGSPGFQHVTTYPSPWSARIWTFFGKDRIRLNLRQLALAPEGASSGDPAQHAGTAVVVRHTRRAAGTPVEQVRKEATAAMAIPGCIRYRAYQETHDEARFMEIFDFAASSDVTDEAFHTFLQRPDRKALDADASDVHHNVYHAIGTPYIKAAG